MVDMNVFRILGDVSHALSKCILIWAIHSNSSAEGVSLITQSLYCLVFITRYLDLFDIYSNWNFVFKIFYIFSSLYVIFLMMRVYARTREREKAWKFGGACLGGSAVLAPLVMVIFIKKAKWGLVEVCWVFSLILESVCVLPQLLLLRQTTVPTVLDSYYLLTLGSYRAFYILNWIWRGLDTNNRKPDAVPIIFGVIQTAFYIDFAWVYYSRQRVKLRHGGLVDADDLRNGWLLRTVFGKRVVGASASADEGDEHGDDEESAPALGARPSAGPRTGSKGWGARGISISADDGVGESERRRGLYEGQEDGIIHGAQEGDEDAKMRDPDELAKILDDDDEDDDDDGVLPGSAGEASVGASVGNGTEWK